MEMRQLGWSGLLVSELSLGTMIFGEDSPRSTPPDEAERIIDHYLDVSDAKGYARFTAAQYQHSLAIRDIEREFIDLFLSEGLGSVPWGPLGGGFLSGKYKRGDKPGAGRLATTPDHDEEAWRRRSTHRNWQIIDTVGEIVEIRGKSYSQVALNWLLSRPEVSSVIIGVRTPAQLTDNLGAVGWRLSDDELARLNQVSAIDQGYPYRMMELYGKR